ncbi:MAG: hypothetical protein ACFFCS_15020 [Candidatus Hodarchaeota archaeon]
MAPEIKRKEVRKKIKARYKSRSTLPGVLFYLGLWMFFVIMGTILFAKFPRWEVTVGVLGIDSTLTFSTIAVAIMVFGFLIFLYWLRRFRNYNRRRKEEGLKRFQLASYWRPILVLVALNGVIIYGLSAFFPTVFTYIPGQEAFKAFKDSLGFIFAGAIAFYASFLPWCMALWYKSTPNSAIWITKLHIRLTNIYKLFKKDAKPKVHKIIAADVPQETSFYMMLKRATSGMTFSLFFTSLFIETFPWDARRFVYEFALAVGETTEGVYIELADVPLHSAGFVGYACYFILVAILPLLTSNFVWFWVLPPTWLMDDAGIVYYRQTFKRRRPPVLKSIGGWFLGMVKPLVAGFSVIGYFQFVMDNAAIVNIDVTKGIDSPLSPFAVSQFIILIYAFPILLTILNYFILLIFQESQFHKLKTHLYQNFLNLKIDPRVTEVKLIRQDKYQKGTNPALYGEGVRPLPPIQDVIGKFTEIGEIDLQNNVLPYADIPVEKKRKGKKRDKKPEDDIGVIVIRDEPSDSGPSDSGPSDSGPSDSGPSGSWPSDSY